MKAWDVLAIARDGEHICWDCMTPEETTFANDESELEDASIVFASEVEEPLTCGRCNEVIEGTEQ